MARPSPDGAEPPRIPHVAALDGLRGLAVLGVLTYHLGHLRGGYLGVDLFFVLSGYLITSLLLAEQRATGRIDLRAFWARRIRRLLPALLVVVAAVGAYAAVAARRVDLATIRADGLATLVYLANWRTIAAGTSYWDISLAPSPLQHTWSLAIEEQFYLLWPLAFVALALAARHRRGATSRWVLIAALIGAGASVATTALGQAAGWSSTRLYQGTDTRAFALLVGVALAAWRAARPTPTDGGRTWPLELAGLVGSVGLAAAWIALDGRSPLVYRGGLTLASVLAVVVIAAASEPRSPVLGRALAVAPLCWFGAISYGLYLWHWPIYQWVDALAGRLAWLHPSHLGTAGTVGAKLGLSLLAAVVSYVVVEQPVRRGWPHGRVAPALGAFGMMVAATALVVGTRGALPPAPSAPTDGLPPHVAGAPVVWVAGDSVALSLAANLHDDPARFGVNPLERTQLGCTVVGADRPMRSFAGDPIAPPPCATRALEGIDAVRPDVVVLWVGSRPNDAIEVDGRWVRACDPAFDDAHREATAELARRLQASGAQVVISTVLRSGARSLPVAGSEERIACVNRAIGEAADLVEGAVVIDPNELLCPDDAPCVESLAGGPVRSDGLHLDRGPGGAQVAAWMIEQALGSTANASLAPDLQARLAAIPERTLAWLDRVTTLAQGVEMDDEGLRYWGERLVLGDARVAVAEALVSSEAWRHQRVVEAHRRWLGTDPDEATERRWTSWLATHTTSELDLALATSEEGEAASGTTHRERAQHLADALALPEAAVDHFEARLDRGVEWDTVVRDGYFSLPASDQRMVGLAPSSPYTPPTEQLIAEFRTTGDERAPLVQALATTP